MACGNGLYDLLIRSQMPLGASHRPFSGLVVLARHLAVTVPLVPGAHVASQLPPTGVLKHAQIAFICWLGWPTHVAARLKTFTKGIILGKHVCGCLGPSNMPS